MRISDWSSDVCSSDLRVEALALSDSIAVMQAGRIVEIGSPQKIYFDADHRYVADFIGRANLISARVLKQEGELTIVDSGLGSIACQHRPLPPGSEATFCIRPTSEERRVGNECVRQDRCRW